MYKVSKVSSKEACAALLALGGAKKPIVDLTYGNGLFWDEDTKNSIIAMDKDVTRAKDLCADFTNLPFADNSIATVIYDPPFHPLVNSRENARFSGLGYNEKELRHLFEMGVSEAWRVCNDCLLVKCQDYIHNHKPQWMPLWAIAICGYPYEWLIATRPSKVISSKWKTPKSLYRNHSDYLLFKKGKSLR